ncbi:SRPBCC family protein [Nocardioides terrisoli]|uniref:hypothetical protein n=1 Tax=Nocardioides terrisoli TaxID=3388267 RepID=UPI00287B70E0|nr:hypothetical protein [Nocardioides marmorisolisilvae]
MNVDVEFHAVIEFAVDEVASCAGDPTKAPEWYANIHSVKWRTTPLVKFGSQMDFEAVFLDRRLSYTYEVVDFEPPCRLPCAPRTNHPPWRPPTPGSRLTAAPA